MIKRTSLNLDFDLLDEARAVLQTRETTETIHRALEDAVRNARLRRLIARRFELASEELTALRTPAESGRPEG
jgi:hypothetical protein